MGWLWVQGRGTDLRYGHHKAAGRQRHLQADLPRSLGALPAAPSAVPGSPALSQSWLLEAKSENRLSENQPLTSLNFPVFGDLRQSCHAPWEHHDPCK